MRIVTINIPDEYLDCIEVLIQLGLYPSRSECIRKAIKEFLTYEQGLNQDLRIAKFKSLKEKQLQGMGVYS